MPYPYGGNVPPGYQPPNIQGGYMSGGQQMAGGHNYYDPAQDPNYVKPNAKAQQGRETGNQKDYFNAELEKKYGGKIPLAFRDDVEKYGWKPGGSYSYKEKIRDKKTGKVETVTRTFSMPQGSSIDQYTNQGYTPSNNYQAANDPYALKGQDPTLGQQYTVSPYGSTQQSNQQGGQNVAQYPNQNASMTPFASMSPEQIAQLNPNQKYNYDRYMQLASGKNVINGQPQTDPYQPQQNVAQYPNQQQGGQLAPGAPPRMGARPPGSGSYKHPSGQYYDESGNPMFALGARPNPSTDPYQLPQGSKPQFSTANGGQPQISTVGNPNAADINPYGGPSAGPRPQQPPFAPGQQAYNGPAIKPMGRPPQSAFGQQNPTIFNQNFAQSPYGQSQLPQNPYRPLQSRRGQQQQGQQWGY